jgi:hypothetical protein
MYVCMYMYVRVMGRKEWHLPSIFNKPRLCYFSNLHVVERKRVDRILWKEWEHFLPEYSLPLTIYTPRFYMNNLWSFPVKCINVFHMDLRKNCYYLPKPH